VEENEEDSLCSYCRKATKKGNDECPRCGNVFRKENDD
jgi:predicted amidophosphoribosyltransferase